jgi:hypothetical protein
VSEGVFTAGKNGVQRIDFVLPSPSGAEKPKDAEIRAVRMKKEVK